MRSPTTVVVLVSPRPRHRNQIVFGIDQQGSLEQPRRGRTMTEVMPAGAQDHRHLWWSYRPHAAPIAWSAAPLRYIWRIPTLVKGRRPVVQLLGHVDREVTRPGSASAVSTHVLVAKRLQRFRARCACLPHRGRRTLRAVLGSDRSKSSPRPPGALGPHVEPGAVG